MEDIEAVFICKDKVFTTYSDGVIIQSDINTGQILQVYNPYPTRQIADIITSMKRAGAL